MTGPLAVHSDAPIRGDDDLLQVFRGGAKPRSAWGVGLEYERFGLDAATARAIPYSGGRGVERVLREMADRFGWSAAEEAGRIIGLERGASRISLEPGGQVELSGRVHRSLHDLRREIAEHLRETAAVGAALGVAWVPIGLQPFSRIEEIEWVPKGRYGVMAPFLGERGALAHHMMKGTAGVQLNFDYAGEADAAEKFRTAMAVTSIVTAICSNSPLYAGSLTGFMSRRTHVWLDTDPARCGLLDLDHAPDRFFRAYTDYALEVPVIFAQRLGRYLPLGGITFRKYIREGHQGLVATIGDWALHLTTIFTEVRLKSYIEVRGADSVAPDLASALAALWKGILEDETARGRAAALVAGVSFERRLAFHRDVCIHGPQARLGDATAADLAGALVTIAAEGLARIANDRNPAGDEAALLDPLRASLGEEGGCPAARLARTWGEDTPLQTGRLIAEAARADDAFLRRTGPAPDPPRQA